MPLEQEGEAPLSYDRRDPYKLSGTLMSELWKGRCTGLSYFVVTFQHQPTQFNKPLIVVAARVRVVAYHANQRRIMAEGTTFPGLATAPYVFRDHCDSIAIEAASMVAVSDADATFMSGQLVFSVRGWPL